MHDDRDVWGVPDDHPHARGPPWTPTTTIPPTSPRWRDCGCPSNVGTLEGSSSTIPPTIFPRDRVPPTPTTTIPPTSPRPRPSSNTDNHNPSNAFLKKRSAHLGPSKWSPRTPSSTSQNGRPELLPPSGEGVFRWSPRTPSSTLQKLLNGRPELLHPRRKSVEIPVPHRTAYILHGLQKVGVRDGDVGELRPHFLQLGQRLALPPSSGEDVPAISSDASRCHLLLRALRVTEEEFFYLKNVLLRMPIMAASLCLRMPIMAALLESESVLHDRIPIVQSRELFPNEHQNHIMSIPEFCSLSTLR